MFANYSVAAAAGALSECTGTAAVSSANDCLMIVALQVTPMFNLQHRNLVATVAANVPTANQLR